MAKRYKQVFKGEIVKDMKKSGLSVHQATAKYKLSPKTIYAWLDGKDPDLRQALKKIRHLEAENEVLVKLVKRLSVDLKKDVISYLKEVAGGFSRLKSIALRLGIHPNLADKQSPQLRQQSQSVIIRVVIDYQVRHPTAGTSVCHSLTDSSEVSATSQSQGSC